MKRRRSQHVHLALVGALSATALTACSDDRIDFDSQTKYQSRYQTYQQCVQQWQDPQYCERRSDGYYYSPIYIFGGGRGYMYNPRRDVVTTTPTTFAPDPSKQNPVSFKTPTTTRVEAPGVRIGRGGFGSSGRRFGGGFGG